MRACEPPPATKIPDRSEALRVAGFLAECIGLIRQQIVIYSSHRLTTAAHKPSVVIEQATSSYSFRFPELSQPI